MSKKSFSLFYDSLEVLDDLTDEQAGQLFKAIRAYEINDEETLDGIMKAVFNQFKTHLNRNKEIYQKKVDVGKEIQKRVKESRKDQERVEESRKDQERVDDSRLDQKRVEDSRLDQERVEDSGKVKEGVNTLLTETETETVTETETETVTETIRAKPLLSPLKKKTAKPKSNFIYPKGYKDIWQVWEDYRKEIKKPLTDKARRIQVKMLFENKADFVEIIETSIQNSWAGLFPTRNKSSPSYRQPQEGSIGWMMQQQEQNDAIDVEVE